MHGNAPGEIPFPLSSFGGLVTISDPDSLPEGASPRTWNTDYYIGQVKTRDALTRAYTGVTGTATTQPLATFVNQDGLRYNLVLDGAGNLFVEDLDSAPGVLALTRSGITPGSLAVSVEGEGVDYMAYVKPLALGGSDMPLQWNPQWCDRITQVGPGAAPIFTPITTGTVNYAIVSITQPPAKSQGSSYFLQSAGPGNQTPGSVITFYYLDATVAAGPDQDLVNAFNSGYPVYLYASFTGTPVAFGPQVVQVTGVGEAQPPGQPRNFYYFTFQVSSVAYTYYQGSGHPGYTAAYQRTLATLTTSTPVPNLLPGGQMTLTGVTPSAWNAQWTVEQTPNASSMVITGSQVTAGVATFNYAVTNNTPPPVAGELVTITNTLNANGQLNVSQWPIASVSGSTTGTFTVNGYPGTLTAAFAAEDGLATTAGTVFLFDPGLPLLGSGTNPIYGTGSGGNLVFNPTGLFIDPGTYQGTVFFITRNGYWTQPAPPVTFTVPINTTQLQVTNIPLGPPNVVARGIALTEAGQNGIPGANFFTLPNPVTFYASNVKYQATSFTLKDNLSTSLALFFTSAVLNSSEAIDIYGYNLFNQIEIGDPSFIVSYALRNFYGGCLNKVQNFLNLSFDGGYLPTQGNTRLLPLGWSASDIYGTLQASTKFGDSWYVKNTGISLNITATLITSGTASYLYLTTIPPYTIPSPGDLVTVTGTTNAGGTLNVTNQPIAAVSPLVDNVIQTSSTGGIATYTTDNLEPLPLPGQRVTVTGTTNGGGIFNVTNAVVLTSGGGAFTVGGFSGTYGAQAETGTAAVVGVGIFTITGFGGTVPRASENGLAVAQSPTAQIGTLYQPAYEDWEGTPIIQPNTAYSARVSARIPSGNTTGNIVVALMSSGGIIGSLTIPFSSLTTNWSTVSGELILSTALPTVPSNLVLRTYGSGMAIDADYEIDRIDIFPTAIPVLTTTLYGSYAGLPEQVDGVTGQVIFTSENQQPLQCATVLYDTLYAMKGWLGTSPGSSLYSLRASSGLEPADWDEPEVAQRSGGAVGPFAWAGGEQWLLAASRAGLYLFVGGQPGKISQEIQQVWDAINWEAAGSVWIDVNLTERRILIGVPMVTPNFYLPFAPVSTNPTSPNVVLMCNFQGLDSGEMLRGEPQMHTTMFGTLNSVDMRRKWSIWEVNSPYATTVRGQTDEQTRFGNGTGNSQVYYLDPVASKDDGVTIDSGYTTSGFPLLSKREMMPQLGPNRVRWTYMIQALTSGGIVNVRYLANRLFFPEPAGYVAWTVPGGFAPGLEPQNDTESSANFAATRTFIEFRQNDGNFGWTLSNVMLKARKDAWNTLRGAK